MVSENIKKIESHLFTYFCDIFGLYVWGEVPSPYDFSYKMKKDFENTASALIKKHFNNPSVITWVLFNESWGIQELSLNQSQKDYLLAMYYKTKSFDNTRLIIDNDGWEHVKSDIITIHDYNRDHNKLYSSYEDRDKVLKAFPSSSLRNVFVDGYLEKDKPILMSEYGGIAYEKTKYKGETWGYGDTISNPEELIEEIKKLTNTLKKIDFNVGFCYTQLSDVEQEINGLLDHEHNFKFHPKILENIFNN